MKVKDIMITDVHSLSPDLSAKGAFYTILSKHISGLPVIDHGGKLTGMFTEKDVLSHILPSYIERVGKFTYGETPKAVLNKLMALENIKVKDIMRKEVVTINEDASLAEAARLMLTEKARRIPVVKEGKVIGIIAREDILKAFAHAAGLMRREGE